MSEQNPELKTESLAAEQTGTPTAAESTAPTAAEQTGTPTGGQSDD